MLFLIIAMANYAQTPTLDSLVNLLYSSDISENPQQKIEIVNQIYEITAFSNPQAAIAPIGQAIIISDSILQDSALVYSWKRKIGETYLAIEKFDQAMRYFVSVKNYYTTIKDSLNLAYAFYDFGKIYAALNVPEIATQEFEKSLELFYKFDDNQGIVLVDIELSKIYSDNFQSDQAYQTLFKALDLSAGNNFLIALTEKNIGELYAQDFETDSAVFFLQKAGDKFQSLNKTGLSADCYLEISKTYLDDDEFALAEQNLNKACDLFNKINIDNKKAECNNIIGELHYKQKQYTQAIKYFEKALEISSMFGYTDQLLISYQFLSNIYTEKKSFAKANEYLQLYIQELEADFDRKQKTGYAEIILSFQNEENRKEIELLEKEDALKTQKLKNKQQQVYGAAIVILLLIFFAFVLYYYIQKQKKINKLLQAQNDKINLQKKEIELQSRILEKATRDLLKQKDRIQEQNTKITASINYASRIQKAMLPSEETFKKYFEDSFIIFQPKETVSGDFYWLAEIKDQKPSLFKTEQPNIKVVVAVVDCTGHGVPGAFMSMLGDAYLNKIRNVQNIHDPSLILQELHKTIRSTLQQQHTENNDGMDLALCIIDKKNKILQFAGAKNPLVYVQNGKMTRIQGDLMSIGGLQKEKERIFQTRTVDITAETIIYLYSDGFQDQFGGKYGRKFMAKPFRDLLFENSNLPFDQQKQNILKTFKKWKGKKYHQMDDITIVGFKV